MNNAAPDFWTDDTSVLFTSYWGWRPKTWAAVGWSNDRGKTHRDHLLEELTDPFITVVYVTQDPDGLDRHLVGKVAGFYLMSHECGHRDQFTHPTQHGRHPEKWVHSLRALRAFSYISDPLPIAREIVPEVSKAGQSIASWGRVLSDPGQIQRLREVPWQEVALYRPDMPADPLDDPATGTGYVQAGPAASQPYMVSPNALGLGRKLYIFVLHGDTDAYLGKASDGRRIIKIGLSIQPEDRCSQFQRAMPQGAYNWRVERPNVADSVHAGFPFKAAVAGENAMKEYLASCADHLGGEFYLASPEQIDIAWQQGHAAAGSFIGGILP